MAIWVQNIFYIMESSLEFLDFQPRLLIINLKNVVGPRKVDIGLSMFVVLFNELFEPFLHSFSLLFGRCIFLSLGTQFSFQVVDSFYGRKLTLDSEFTAYWSSAHLIFNSAGLSYN